MIDEVEIVFIDKTDPLDPTEEKKLKLFLLIKLTHRIQQEEKKLKLFLLIKLTRRIQLEEKKLKLFLLIKLTHRIQLEEKNSGELSLKP